MSRATLISQIRTHLRRNGRLRRRNGEGGILSMQDLIQVATEHGYTALLSKFRSQPAFAAQLLAQLNEILDQIDPDMLDEEPAPEPAPTPAAAPSVSGEISDAEGWRMLAALVPKLDRLTEDQRERLRATFLRLASEAAERRANGRRRRNTGRRARY